MSPQGPVLAQAPASPPAFGAPPAPPPGAPLGAPPAGPPSHSPSGSGAAPFDFSLPAAPVTEPGEELLEQLRGLHLPAPVSFWPLAPGWWMLVGALVLAALIAAFLEWRRRQTLAYRAGQQLKAIAADLAGHPDSRAVAAASALLLRRIVVSRGRDAEQVTLTGEAWERVLGEGKGAMAPELARFVAAAPYVPPQAPGGDAVARDVLVAALARWIKVNS